MVDTDFRIWIWIRDRYTVCLARTYGNLRVRKPDCDEEGKRNVHFSIPRYNTLTQDVKDWGYRLDKIDVNQT